MNESGPSSISTVDSIGRSSARLHRGFLASVAIAGLLATAIIAYQVRRVGEVKAAEARTEVALGILRPVVTSVREELAELSAFARFVELTRPLSREAFHAFADRVDARYSTVDWVRRIDPLERAQTEVVLSDYHLRPIRIRSAHQSGESGPLWVPFFTSPPAKEAEHVGVDLTADPIRRELLERASRTRSIEGQRVHIGGVGAGAQYEIILAAPVFETPANVRARGVVLLGFRPRDIHTEDRAPRDSLPGARLTIIQRSDGGTRELYTSMPEDGVVREPIVMRIVPVSGGTIELTLSAPPSSIRWRDRFDPGSALAGTIFTLLATLLMASQLAARRQDHRMADLRLANDVELSVAKTERARWQSALSSAGDGLWDWDARTNRVYFSTQWKRMLGYEDAEVGDSLEEWSSRVHPDDLPAAMARLEAHFRGDTESYESVHRLRCKDGSYKWILDRGRVIDWLAPGTPARVIGTHADVDVAKRLEESLRRTNAHLEGVLRAAAEVSVITTDPEGIITGWNAGAERLLGYTADETVGKLTPEAFHDPKEMQGRSDEVFAATGRRYTGFKVFVAHTTSQESDVRLWKYIRKDGGIRTVRLMVAAMRDDAGLVLGYVGMAMDVTRELEQARVIEAGAQLLKKLSEQVPGAIYQYRLWPDGHARFPFASDGIVDVYEVTAAEAAVNADAVMQRIHPEDLARVEQSITDSARHLTPWVQDYRVVLPWRGQRWLRGEAQPERLSDGSTLWHGYTSDITELKLLQLELFEHATHDPLTRAFNRRHLDRTFVDDLESRRREGIPVSLVMLDIDDFKRINDTFGHDVGDRVLVEIVEMLRQHVRTSDRVYRTGGEELVVVCPNTNLEGAEHLAKVLLARIGELTIGPVSRVTASFGVAEVGEGDTLATVLKRADEGVYAAKAAGKNRVVALAG